MARYFWIACGLRGAYCDGNGYIVKCDTRRELKSALQWEADSIRDAGGIGLSKRVVARLAALVWSDRKATLPYMAGYKFSRDSVYAWSLHVGQSTRADYLAQSE